MLSAVALGCKVEKIMQQSQHQQHKQIYRFPNQYHNIVERTGLSRATIYRMIDTGDFPRPLRLAARAIGWTEEQISIWESSRPYSTPRQIDRGAHESGF
jgi:prophage regulatory protein